MRSTASASSPPNQPPIPCSTGKTTLAISSGCWHPAGKDHREGLFPPLLYKSGLPPTAFISATACLGWISPGCAVDNGVDEPIPRVTPRNRPCLHPAPPAGYHQPHGQRHQRLDPQRQGNPPSPHCCRQAQVDPHRARHFKGSRCLARKGRQKAAAASTNSSPASPSTAPKPPARSAGPLNNPAISAELADALPAQ